MSAPVIGYALRRNFQVPKLSCHRAAGGAYLVSLLAVSAGCSSPVSRFQIIDHAGTHETHRYSATFSEAYYDIDGLGNLDLILRRGPDLHTADGSEVTQLLHIRSVWRSIPGMTNANPTQVNGTICYALVGGNTGTTFEGAGSVFFDHNADKGTLSGTVEWALLRPRRRLSSAKPLFSHAEISGEFHAVRDRRKVVRMVNEIDRLFRSRPAPATSR